MAGKPLIDDAPPQISGELSPKMREYLAGVYRLSDHEGDPRGYVSTSSLATLVDVSAPAVNRMVTKLREMSLLQHEPYQGIRLTDAGKREALKHLRKHRIAEAFLVNVLGYGWHEVHEEAIRIGEGLTEALTMRMWQMAGEPLVCPHGEPIATIDGEIAPLNDLLLTDAPHKTMLRITRVRTRESSRLEYLAALMLTPGSLLEVIHAAPFNGPLQLRVAKEYRIVGHNLAEMIRVRPAEKD